jgi:hypothetical protein
VVGVLAATRRLVVLTKTMRSGSEPVASANEPRHTFVDGRNQDTRDEALIVDFLFVDFGTGFVDHDHASTLVAVIKINGDLTGDQVGGFPGVVLVLAIQSNRIFEPDTVSDVEMKNGHWLLLKVNAVKPSVFLNAVRLHQASCQHGAKVPAGCSLILRI